MPDDPLDLVEDLIDQLANLKTIVGTLQERMTAVEEELEGGEDAEPDGLDEWVEWHGHLASMVSRVQALRNRTNEVRQKAATRGGALAGIIGKGRPSNAPTEPIPAESH
jgi:hypothetical protein